MSQDCTDGRKCVVGGYCDDCHQPVGISQEDKPVAALIAAQKPLGEPFATILHENLDALIDDENKPVSAQKPVARIDSVQYLERDGLYRAEVTLTRNLPAFADLYDNFAPCAWCAESERIEAIATKKLGEEIIKTGTLQSKLTEHAEEIRIIRANLAQLEKDFDQRNEELTGAFAALAVEQGMRIAAENRVEWQAAKIERLKKCCSKLNREVCQILGKALKYPWYKDDQKNFPGATEKDGICEGDHVAESIAAEAANSIKSLEAEVERLKADVEHYRFQADESGMERVRYGQKIDDLKSTIERQRKVIELAGRLLPKRLDNGFVQFGKYFAEQEDVFSDPYNKMCQFKRQYLTMCQEVLLDIAELEKGYA